VTSDIPGAAGVDEGERRIDAAVASARRFVDEAMAVDARSSRRERRRRARLRVLMRDPQAADFTARLTDEVVRIVVASRAARRFEQLVATADLSSFSRADRMMLAIGSRLAPRAPRLVMPLVLRRLRAEAAGVILPADDPELADHLARRREQGMRCNLNVLGEAIVGDAEARRRLDMVLTRLRRDDVNYVSVKISAICTGVSALAFDDTVERVGERLRELYRVAASFDPPKFVNLDMEEYRDLDLTVAVFRRLLDEAEFEHLDAGIVLQAYLPDVLRTARELGEWATDRHRRAGGRTKIRIVKGANLAMETVEAELRGWAPAPFGSKAEVDANYKAVLDVLCDGAFDQAVRVGVASHNLFDVAWALELRREMAASGRPDRIEIEMLEGMAPAQAGAVCDAADGLLLYAPVVSRRDFPAAVAYLVRRLDENTSPDNFLSHVFDLGTDPGRFDIEADRFRAAARARLEVDGNPRRHQDRSLPPPPTDPTEPFQNAPDTDWTRPANRRWIDVHLARAGASDAGGSDRVDVTVESVDACVASAVAAQASWRSSTAGARADILHGVGDVFEAHRGRILATMAGEASKTAGEGDPEVSEAIDFARYYASDARRLARLEGATPEPLGTVVVTPPWNFPFAIPAGGVLAALGAGNTVILKPAPQTVRTAALIAELCWEAGVPRDVVQFLPAPDGDVGRRLVTHPDVDAVVLTGAAETASMFLGWRPRLRLHAETSGKNALVITATADIDNAVADLVRSAFGHAGQKCSAASLAIVEAPLYDDPVFLERIRDAGASLRVGPPTETASEVGPLVEPPGEKLERALTRLEPGESWLLAPECRSADRRLWSPGIRLGVRPDSWFARTECFGPVLGLVRADDLDRAIEIQNGSDFGLTAGLHALDPSEIERWLDRVAAGNLYVNRGITGAIVRRQPFGGWKRSAVGPTVKAGGPNYVASLCRWTDDQAVPITDVAAGFHHWMEGAGGSDVTGLAAEHNVFRYRPLTGGVAVRFGSDATDHERAIVDRAAHATGCRLIVSEDRDESPEWFGVRLPHLGVDRVRLIGTDDDDVAIRVAAHTEWIAVDDSRPTGAAEIELPRWLHEQAVSITMHRHGRVATGQHFPAASSAAPGTNRGTER
jgi:RHH-type proline utilization regulon transcriptional repressor/proline dehydrogenase/delta 1-pyrroline-5-carboxylate dehydrogenase